MNMKNKTQEEMARCAFFREVVTALAAALGAGIILAFPFSRAGNTVISVLRGSSKPSEARIVTSTGKLEAGSVKDVVQKSHAEWTLIGADQYTPYTVITFNDGSQYETDRGTVLSADDVAHGCRVTISATISHPKKWKNVSATRFVNTILKASDGVKGVSGVEVEKIAQTVK